MEEVSNVKTTKKQQKTGTDGKLTVLPTPSRSNHSFDGWFTAENGGTSVTTETVFTANTTIYDHSAAAAKN